MIFIMKKNNQHIDELLIKGLEKGDQNSYKKLFEHYYPSLYNYVYKLSSNSYVSEDLVQNVLLRIWEKKSSLKITSSLRNYLLRACHNEFLMYLRQQKKEYDSIDELKWEALLEIHNTPEEDQTETDWLKIERAIELLPKKCREVFKLSRLEQKKHKEIAEILGISTKTVEIHISKALRFLKANISVFFL